MGSLFGALQSAAYSLRTFDRGLTVVQNNVTNADAPGYVKQSLVVTAKSFDPDHGGIGGVESGGLISARDEYAERSVQQQQQRASFAQQRAADLKQLEASFPVTEQGSIPQALNALFASFTQLSVSPNDTGTRQFVLDQAAGAANVFRQTAAQLKQTNVVADQQIQATVEDINRVAAKLQAINQQRMNDFRAQSDPGLDASLHSTLEELAQLADYTTIASPNGGITVMIGGQSPLVMGDQVFALSTTPGNTAHDLVNSQGQVITKMVSGGKLGALLDKRNQTIPDLQASLDQMAQGFADAVNTTLAGGVDASGATPATPLFTYQSGQAAGTLSVSSLQPSQLAAALPGAPGGNGNALQLAALRDAGLVNGATLTQFYGNVSSQLGRESKAASQNQELQQSVLVQTRSIRDDVSHVSLDEEAAHLMELQRGYQAVAKLISVLDELTETVLGLVR